MHWLCEHLQTQRVLEDDLLTLLYIKSYKVLVFKIKYPYPDLYLAGGTSFVCAELLKDHSKLSGDG